MMRIFLLNLFLAIVYAVLTDDASLFTFVIGFALGAIVLDLYCRGRGQRSYIGRFIGLARFAVYFITILIKANLQVAWEVITPGFGMSPRIIRYSVEGLSDLEITVLSSAITLTPGTLSADIDEEHEHLYVHCMYGRDREAAVRELDELKQRLLREVLRS